MGNKSEKTGGRKLGLLKGGRKREDHYDKCRKSGTIDIDGEYHGSHEQIGNFPDYHCGSEEEELRRKASGIVRQITKDPLEHDIADLMLDYGYTEEEVAEILNISLARVKWFMRKVEGWKRKGGGVDP